MYNENDISNKSWTRIKTFKDKTVLLRTCLNVVIDEKGNIVDESRVTESIDFIIKLAKKTKKLIILGHLGRPKAKDVIFSFRTSVYDRLKVLLKAKGIELEFAQDLNALKSLNNTVLLENIRFFDEEESENLSEKEAFAKELANNADIFINNSFPDYRLAASTYDVARFLPGFTGPNFENEMLSLGRLKLKPKSPYVAILGGAKLSEKIDTLSTLGKYADKILVGGAMAYTLMKSIGINVGRSLVEDDKLDVAFQIMNTYAEKIVLPVDHICLNEFKDEKDYAALSTQAIVDLYVEENKPYDIAVDIGGQTLNLFEREIKKAKTILWNGPMGVFEWERGYWGTKWIGKAITKSKAYSVVGGGDTITALHRFNIKGFDFISTGGGAMLAFLANEKFPTFDVLDPIKTK